ncbi:Serine/threonine-protein kinase pkn1 [Thalassoglobus neptunius]|uniref:Serine/threonine-protein kinase pkn1 n=1 Tax=Thalassoglobus neptunius TaxID=1938619 RepID=A0A5C5VRQ9_9PLAN|nr:SUMF1/EgtB/PvdO family nonheme iron enzyme [Thalassoglobus neptunius]TWT40857.1 Serine/threonine-protein kinase pkn1 [Thalassoglobus neptunius]
MPFTRGPLRTLAEIIHDMTGDERIEKIIADHAKFNRDRWIDMLNGTSSEGHMLETHVEPRLSVELRPQDVEPEDEGSEEREVARSEFRELQQGLGEFLEENFTGQEDWILISERAGGGKTVLSWQLCAALSEGDEPYFVMRYENDWPDDLRQDLVASVARIKSFPQSGFTAAEVVAWLLERRRIVVIFDALDQVDGKTAGVLKTLASQYREANEAGESLRVIVTSRPNAVQAWPDGFNRTAWRHFHLQEFDEDHQAEYLQKFADLREQQVTGQGARVREMWQAATQFGPDSNNAHDDILSLPNNLRSLRVIIEDSLTSRTPMRTFRTAGDLRWETASRNLHRDPSKGTEGESQIKKRPPEDVSKLMRAAACLAFEMLLRTGTYFTRSDQDIGKIHTAAAGRCGVDAEVWEKYQAMLRDSLTKGNAVLRRINQVELSFPSQKTMEFFVGLYLARYADDEAILALAPEIGSEKWDESWEFAIEMPVTTDSSGNSLHDPEVYECSLHGLFSVPEAHPRPAKPMFLAWQMLEREESLKKIKDAVLSEYRNQFARILVEEQDGQPNTRAKLAAELILEDDVPKLLAQGRDAQWKLSKPEWDGLPKFADFEDRSVRERRQRLRRQLERLQALEEESALNDWVGSLVPEDPAYALCSDASKPDKWRKGADEREYSSREHLTFLMGAALHDPENGIHGDAHANKDRETPWQRVAIDSFYMGTGCVTWGQYRLFDRHRKASGQPDHVDPGVPLPDDDRPMTDVSWHDAFSFALWIGEEYRLPSEVEWEGAAWGGIDREQHWNYVIGVAPFTDDFTSQHVNYDGNYPMSGPKSVYREKTVPVRHPENQANGFGLWQMSGNVWEWCRSVFQEKLQTAIAQRDQPTKETNVSDDRSLRGGSWYFSARYCRCSNRLRIDAEDRDVYYGFRLSRTRSP